MKARHQRRQRIVDKEIRRVQASGKPVVPYVSFSRVVREILAEQGQFNIRGAAMRALQCAAEDRVTEIFAEAHRLAQYQNRETVIQSDMTFIVSADDRMPVSLEEEPELPPPEPAPSQ